MEGPSDMDIDEGGNPQNGQGLPPAARQQSSKRSFTMQWNSNNRQQQPGLQQFVQQYGAANVSAMQNNSVTSQLNGNGAMTGANSKRPEATAVGSSSHQWQQAPALQMDTSFTSSHRQAVAVTTNGPVATAAMAGAAMSAGGVAVAPPAPTPGSPDMGANAWCAPSSKGGTNKLSKLLPFMRRNK